MALQYPLASGGTAGTQSTAALTYPLPAGGAWATVATDVPATLTGIDVGTKLGTMTPTREVSITGVTSDVLLGTLTPTQSAELSQISISVTLGDVEGVAQPGLGGIDVGTKLGTMSPASSVALSGVQIAVAVGSVTPSDEFVSAALTGVQVGVNLGRMRAPATIYDMPWTQMAYRSTTIPSYLYVQYNDDDDLQAFVAAYNELAQEVISWFVNINLPIYTGPLIIRELLDWVAEGLYGIKRPTLPSGTNRNLGPLNTYMMNVLPPNGRRTITPTEVFATTDDIFKRIITWNFYKGDGRTFNVRWLKRRVMRFLIGENGTDPGIADTYPISVTFGHNREVTIHILPGLRTVTGGAIPNVPGLNTVGPNQLDTTFTPFDTFEHAPTFKAAVEAGVLQLPFQYTWNVVIT